MADEILAFPSSTTILPNGEIIMGAEGMSLRDWFAGQALIGLCAAETASYRYDSHEDRAVAA